MQDLIELKETIQIQTRKNINLDYVFLLQNNYFFEDIHALEKEFVISKSGLEDYLIEQKWNINDIIYRLEEEDRCEYLNTFNLVKNGYTKEDIEKAINNGASHQKLETLSIEEILSINAEQNIFETLIHFSGLNKNPEDVLEQIKSMHTTQEQKLFSGTIQPTLNKKEYEKDKEKYIKTLSPEQRGNFEDTTQKKSGLLSRLKRKIYNTESKEEKLYYK